MRHCMEGSERVEDRIRERIGPWTQKELAIKPPGVELNND